MWMLEPGLGVGQKNFEPVRKGDVWRTYARRRTVQVIFHEG